jgi:hypothetical protein
MILVLISRLYNKTVRALERYYNPNGIDAGRLFKLCYQKNIYRDENFDVGTLFKFFLVRRIIA